MKYKIGDKIKIRSWSDMEQEFGLNMIDNIKISNHHFMKMMKIYCEKMVIIERVYSDFYMIKESDFLWTDDMINHATTLKLNIEK